MGARSAIVESEDVVWTGRPWMEGGGAPMADGALFCQARADGLQVAASSLNR